MGPPHRARSPNGDPCMMKWHSGANSYRNLPESEKTFRGDAPMTGAWSPHPIPFLVGARAESGQDNCLTSDHDNRWKSCAWMDVLRTGGLFCPGSSFRSRRSLGDGTGNGPMISLRPSLITAHHSVSSLSDPAREASPCSRYLRPARDVDTTCTGGRKVHESMATKVRAHRAPNLVRGCVGRSHRSALRVGLRNAGAKANDAPGRRFVTNPTVRNTM